MKRITLIFSSLMVASTVAIVACNNSGETAKGNDSTATASMSHDDMIARGKYLVDVIGCRDCHSPKVMTPMGPVPDSSRDLSGHPANDPAPPLDTAANKGWMTFGMDLTTFNGPWGTTYAANITSDESGIGSWTEAQFVKCIREGKLKGMDNTRPIMPPMPWQNFRQATDEDLKAIFAYLKSTKPVNNVVPAPKLAPPPAH